MLWLTEMEQKGDALTIQGRANTLQAIADLVTNLGNSALLVKPLDMQNEVETLQAVQGQPGVELYKFTVRANVDRATATKPATKPASAPVAGGGGGGAAAR